MGATQKSCTFLILFILRYFVVIDPIDVACDVSTNKNRKCNYKNGEFIFLAFLRNARKI